MNGLAAVVFGVSAGKVGSNGFDVGLHHVVELRRNSSHVGQPNQVGQGFLKVNIVFEFQTQLCFQCFAGCLPFTGLRHQAMGQFMA
ncbi:hypothetical protein RGQ30_30150 [Limnobacter thiooxidans]|uniref:Uncharacterized protein n=1 Tax=Limnobacter thiooxidans TaxID=131080 RepID=A0AA86J0V8_9BURK|nr:hypothetical protein RGQ30_30150 [Limnobacter thiooxidans]